MNRDFAKPARDLIQEGGYPINLQLSLSDATGMTVYTYRGGKGGTKLISSKKPLEVRDAIYAELESEIKAGIDAAKRTPRT